MSKLRIRALEWSDAHIGLFIALVAFLTYAFIGPGYGVANPNAISRMGLAYAILDRHSVTLGEFAPLTVDKAEFNGEAYLDKAPGLSFMSLPVLAATESLMTLVKFDSNPVADGGLTSGYDLATYVCSIFTSSLFTAFAAFVFYYLSRRLRFTRSAALLGTVGFAMATPAMGWATQFFGHAVAGDCLFIAFALVVLATDSNSRHRHALPTGVLVGVLLVWSVVVEYTSAPAAMAVGVFFLWRLRPRIAGSKSGLIAGGALGGVLAAMPLLVYNYLAFGSPFHVGYESVVGFDGMRQGILGISFPKGDALYGILLGTRRGILWISPFLILSPIAYGVAFRRLGKDITAVLLVVPLLYLAINSGYYYWDGGGSVGPRHITPALSFISFAFVPLWDSARGLLRHLLSALVALSAFISFACANVTMIGIEGLYNPLTQLIFPRLARGVVHNVLTYVGLTGLVTLLAYPVIWILAASLTNVIVPHVAPRSSSLAR